MGEGSAPAASGLSRTQRVRIRLAGTSRGTPPTLTDIRAEDRLPDLEQYRRKTPLAKRNGGVDLDKSVQRDAEYSPRERCRCPHRRQRKRVPLNRTGGSRPDQRRHYSHEHRLDREVTSSTGGSSSVYVIPFG